MEYNAPNSFRSMTTNLVRRRHCLLTVGLAAIAWVAPATANTELVGSQLANIAKQVAPGEFRPLKAGLPKGVNQFSELLRGYRPDGRGAPPIDTWTDSAQWDPKRKRAFFLGLRKSNRFLSYHAMSNFWEEIPLEVPNAPPRFEKFGHLYGRTALDWKRGHFYRLSGTLHRYSIDDDKWDRFDQVPLAGYIPIGWHYGLDLLVGTVDGKLYGFRDGQSKQLGQTAVDGHHSSAKYNPKRGDMLFIGGNKSRRSVDLVSANGQIRHMKDAPFGFGISSDDLTHDPISGNYLVLHRDRVLWEYQPDLDEWRIALDMRDGGATWPFKGGIVPFVVDELGVIVWMTTPTPLIYRHKSVFAKDAPQR
jgi:hypothetical protein